MRDFDISRGDFIAVDAQQVDLFNLAGGFAGLNFESMI